MINSLVLKYDSGKYYSEFIEGKTVVGKSPYYGDKEANSFKKLVLAYRKEGVEVVNGNLDDKIFNSIITEKPK